MKRFQNGDQRNKISLTLKNSELDFFKEMVEEMPESLKDMKEYIQSRINNTINKQ